MRYGVAVSASHHQMAAEDAGPEKQKTARAGVLMAASSRFSKVDEYGFERTEDFDYNSYEQFMEEYLGVLARRASKWDALLRRGRGQIKRNATLKRYVRKGIPKNHRSMVWMSLSGAAAMKERQPELYLKRLNGLLQPTVVESIAVDVPRTFPDNIYFTDTADGQLKHLHNVLVAYAHDNRAIGYCQGLNYIAAILLLVTNNEEDSFWLLKALTERILTDSYYSGNLVGVKTDFAVLSELVKLKAQALHQHIESTGVTWPLVTAKWFMCIYADVLPTETVLRIWDCLFYEGPKIIFRVALTMVLLNRENLLSCHDLPEVITAFKSMLVQGFVIHSHNFMKSIFTVPGSLPRVRIERLQEKCRQEILLEDEKREEAKLRS